MGHDLKGKKNYKDLARHYLECFRKNGDGHLGADWRSSEEAAVRYQVMLDLVPAEERASGCSLLDFGCGTSVFFDYLVQNDLLGKIAYAGLDINQGLVDTAREKFPNNPYYCLDILKGGGGLPVFDYAVMNGVFTQCCDMDAETMFAFMRSLLSAVFLHVRKGLAFNVMSKHVDWEKEGNFYLSFDQIGAFMVKELGRDFVIRHDYKLYEYTVYLYK